MDLEHMSDQDKKVIGEALRAAVDGPFFPEWEFHTLFGLTTHEVRTITHAWPNVGLNDRTVALAVNNSFNNLLAYPHRQDFLWSQWISVDREELEELYSRIRGRSGETYID